MKNEILEELEEKLKKSLTTLKKDLSKLRTGVASVSLLEDIKVTFYNQPTPLNQVATIAVPDSRTITMLYNIYFLVFLHIMEQILIEKHKHHELFLIFQIVY